MRRAALTALSAVAAAVSFAGLEVQVRHGVLAPDDPLVVTVRRLAAKEPQKR